MQVVSAAVADHRQESLCYREHLVALGVPRVRRISCVLRSSKNEVDISPNCDGSSPVEDRSAASAGMELLSGALPLRHRPTYWQREALGRSLVSLGHGAHLLAHVFSHSTCPSHVSKVQADLPPKDAVRLCPEAAAGAAREVRTPLITAIPDDHGLYRVTVHGGRVVWISDAAADMQQRLLVCEGF